MFSLVPRSTRSPWADIFPQFSYPVLRVLEPQYLDLLYEAQVCFSPGVLGENATKDFILRHVFGIAAELVKSDADLLRTLLRRHYRLQLIPQAFVDRLVQVLHQNGRFANCRSLNSLRTAVCSTRFCRSAGRSSSAG